MATEVHASSTSSASSASSEPLLTRPSLRDVLSALADDAGRPGARTNCPCQLDDARPRPGGGALARSPVRRRPAGPRENTNEPAWRHALEAPLGESHQPWFVRVLVGLGAWVAALLFALAAAMAGIADSRAALGVLGFAAFGGGVALRYAARGEFPVQLALAMSVGGRMMVYAAVFHHGDRPAAWCVALTLEALGVLAYPDPVGRFVATLGVCSAAFGLASALKLPLLSRQVLTLGIAAGATVLWVDEPTLLASRRGAPLQRPVGFGLVVALLVVLLVELWTRSEADAWGFSLVAAGLWLLIIVVEREVLRHALATRPRLGGYRVGAPRGDAPVTPAPAETRAIVYAGTIALGVLGQLAPGLMGALLVMALGAHRRNGILFGVATVFLVFFGSHFYSSLTLSLLAKSGVLLASGLVCLLVRWPLARAAKVTS